MTITVTISQSPASLSFEVGSFKEVVGTLQENKEVFQEFCSVASELGPVEETSSATASAAASSADAAPASGKRRGRKANQPDPATATAPAPIAPPTAAPAPVSPALQAQVETAAAAGTIPAFLDRTAAPAAPAPVAPPAAAAPPPVLPAAPSVAPTPPVSTLAPKITAEVDRRAQGAPDSGKAIQDWLVQTAVAAGFVSRPAPDQWPTYAETVAVLPFQPDDKLTPIAAALQLA
jgi:hypothetical protein